MSQDLTDRLRRLGVHRGARNLKPTVKRAPDTDIQRRRTGETDLAKLFPSGQVHTANSGACFVVDRVYPLDYLHGDSPLSSLLEQDPATLSVYCKEERLTGLAFRDFVFLDTETTGLHGAGTIAFMVGIAFFERSSQGDVLIVRQFFLRDHDDEAAMLELLADFLAQRNGLITFNGHSFDLNLLDNRYLMNRSPVTLRRLPHIDLLPLSRRLWRARIGSVALANLETELLGVRRTQADVPGWLIPSLYNEYLRSRDAGQLARVFYHNQIDMLSMVTLSDHILRMIASADRDQDPIDHFSLGRWQADIGLEHEAEETLNRVVKGDLPLAIYHKALQRLALLFKRQQRYGEAVPLWQQWAATSFDEIDAHVELAKYYEWHGNDIAQAERWTQAALSLVDSWSSVRANLIRPELVHRLSRLQRKQSPS